MTDNRNLPALRRALRSRRHAHSLVEILVVLIIVGVLVAVTVPAVQRARESARQTQCTNRQGQLAKAVQLYVAAETNGRYPGFRYQDLVAGGPTIGWAAQVLGYLGRNDLDPTQSSYIETLVCPSNSGPRDQPRLNYVVNGGREGVDSPADGIFFDHAKPAAERVYISRDDFADGLRNTLLLAENLDATNWNVTDETNQCILWPLTVGNEVNTGQGPRPSSHHPDGFIAAFADGSVKFIAEKEINDDTNVHTAQSNYVALLTPGGHDLAGGVGDDGDTSSGGDNSSQCTGTTGDLLAHWPFEDNGDWGEDATGNGFDGLLFGGAAVVSDSTRGDVLDLDGVDDHVSVDANVDITGSCYSATAWFKTTGGGFPQDVLSCHVGADHGMLFELANSSTMRFLHRVPISTGGGTNLYDSTGTYPDSTWHHVAGVKDGPDVRLYMDGVEVQSDHDGSTFPVLFVVKIGRLKDGNGRFFRGRIDDVRIYGRTLSPSEVATLAGN